MFCTHCGAPLDEGAKFCTNCGEPVELEESAEVVEETQKLETPYETPRCAACGAELEEGARFCTNCGAAQEAATQEPAYEEAAYEEAPEHEDVQPAFETISSNQEAVQEQLAPQKKSKKGLIIGIIVAVVLIAVAAAVAIFVVIPSMNGSANTEETSQEETSADEETASKDSKSAQAWKSVALPNSYETKAKQIADKAVATYSFSYPKDWDVTADAVDDYTEIIDLDGPDGASIGFIQMRDMGSKPVEFEFEKIADSNFHLSGKSGDLDSSSKFVVVKATQKQDSSDDTQTFLVLLPETVVEQGSASTYKDGTPYFMYQSTVCFYCQITDDMSEDTQNQIIAILRSLQISKAPEAEKQASDSSTSSSSSSSANSQSEYLLADSSDRRYSSSELESMSNYELFIARNEIYARHGRKFRNQELVNYFSKQPWYQPSIEPDSFTSDMLSGVERDNVNAMISIEKSRGSEYLK